MPELMGGVLWASLQTETAISFWYSADKFKVFNIPRFSQKVGPIMNLPPKTKYLSFFSKDILMKHSYPNSKTRKDITKTKNNRVITDQEC